MLIKGPLVFLLFFFCSFLNAELKIQHWATENGARVYFVENHDLPMLDIEVSFQAGSSRDSVDKNGLASITNHLMISGSGGINERDLSNRFTDIGAQLNSLFDRDKSSFSLRTLSEKSKQAIELFKLVLQKPDFKENILEREKRRYIANISQAQTMPESIAYKAFMYALYGDHPYGLPESGKIETLIKINSGDLIKFYKQHYLANQATIVIVGDLTRTEAEKVSKELIDELPVDFSVNKIPLVEDSKKSETRISHPAKQAHLYFGSPVLKRGDPDFFPLYVGNHILGGSGFGSRLTNEIREGKGLVYSVYSYFVPLAQAGPFQIGLQTKKEQIDEALKLVKSIIVKFIQKGPSRKELQAAKDNIIGGFPLRLDSNKKILSYISMMAFYNYPLDYLKTFSEKINVVTIEEIKSAFQRRVDMNKFSIVIVGVD
jgi:zinc protease